MLRTIVQILLFIILIVLIAFAACHAQCEAHVYDQSFQNGVGRFPTSGTTLNYSATSKVDDGEGIMTDELGGNNIITFWDNGQAAPICTCTKKDHTGGGRFMVVNSPQTNPFYSFIIDGIAYPDTYKFGYYAINIHKSGSGQLNPVIKVVLSDGISGVRLDSFTNTLPFTSAWSWVNYEMSIMPISGVLRVDFYDTETGKKGNDFALDDIYLKRFCTVLPLGGSNAPQSSSGNENPVMYEAYNIIGQLVYRGKERFNQRGLWYVKSYYKHRVKVEREWIN